MEKQNLFKMSLKKSMLSVRAKSSIAMGSILTALFLLGAGQASAWTVKADFDSGTTGSQAQGTSGFGWAGTATLFSTDKAASGSKSAKMTWPKGNEGWGVAHGEFTYPSVVTNGGEVWARGNFYFATPWSWACSPVVKVLRGVHVSTSSGSNIGYLSVFADSDGNILLSNEPGDAQISTGVKFDLNAWQTIEMYVKLSTSDPIFRIWKNGSLIYESRSQTTLGSSTNRADLAYIMTNWNGGAPQSQVQYIDDLIITTDKPVQVDSKGNPMIGSSNVVSTPPAVTAPAPNLIIIR
jgi:hypothetical protein